VSRDRWPPRSPDLTPLDFYLFGSLKTKVFRNRIHTLEELQAAIVEEINNIDQHTFQRVFNNMKKNGVGQFDQANEIALIRPFSSTTTSLPKD
jgi:ERCC4-type nuclease